MKKCFIYSLLAVLTTATLHSCQQPSGAKTETHQLTRTYRLTEDSTKGILSLDMHIDLPVKHKNKEALLNVRRDIIELAFGEKYLACADNELLPRLADDMYQDYRAENLPYINEAASEDIGFSFNNEYELEITTGINDGRIFSNIIDQYIYTGGAHGVRSFICSNYSMTDGKRLTEEDLFNTGYEQPLTQLIIEHIKYNREDTESPEEVLQNYWIDEIAPNGNFYITTASLRYVFNPYEIAPYSTGYTVIDLPFAELNHLLKDQNPISYLY